MIYSCNCGWSGSPSWSDASHERIADHSMNFMPEQYLDEDIEFGGYIEKHHRHVPVCPKCGKNVRQV